MKAGLQAAADRIILVESEWAKSSWTIWNFSSSLAFNLNWNFIKLELLVNLIW